MLRGGKRGRLPAVTNLLESMAETLRQIADPPHSYLPSAEVVGYLAMSPLAIFPCALAPSNDGSMKQSMHPRRAYPTATTATSGR